MININSKNVNIKCSAYVNILLSVSSDDFDIVVSKMKIHGLENETYVQNVEVTLMPNSVLKG
jgi:hypothetical protein